MSVAVASRVPTLENAKAAAEACGEAHENVEDVLVFGSVARGDAGADSDIDLLVLVAQDIDGREVALTNLFSKVAETASGVGCDVVVRTAYQWEHLTINVSASFDAAIEPETLKLFHREIAKGGHLNGSLNGMPRDNSEVASNHARTAAANMRHVANTILLFGRKGKSQRSPELNEPEEIETEDVQELLSKAHLAIELLIQSIGASAGNPSLGTKHELEEMVDRIKGDNTTDGREVREAIHQALEPLRTLDGKVQIWRMVPYAGREETWVELSTKDNAFNHVKAAVALARMTAHELVKRPSPSHEPAKVSALLLDRADEIEERLPPDVGLAWGESVWDYTEETDDYWPEPDLPTQGEKRHDGPGIDF